MSSSIFDFLLKSGMKKKTTKIKFLDDYDLYLELTIPLTGAP